MTNYFEATVKYLKEADNGLIRTMKSQFLVDAMTFTEAEARLTAELADVMQDLNVLSLKRSNIREVVFYGDTPKFFRCKVTYSTMDEGGEKDKKVSNYFLVNAESVESADERLKDHLKNMVVPYEVPSITETKIVEVMEYSPKTAS